MQRIYIIQNAEGILAEAAEILTDTIKFILTSDENLFSIIFNLRAVRALCSEQRQFK